jgi:hypothetical protein
LHFGPDRQKYYLPEVLLQKLENVPSRDPWTGEVHLVDVDASTGHVLIHFLHTGLYETLKDGNIEDVQDPHRSIVRNEFQKAVLAIEAAKKYGLSGLRELAQTELERRGKDMCLRDAVRAIQKDFMAGPPDEHVWLRDYMSEKVRWTFKHDPSTLTALDFFDSIESPSLTRLLAQIIVGLYSEKVEQLREERTATAKIPSVERNEPPKRITMSSNSRPASVERFGAFDDSPAACDPYNLGRDPGSGPEASTPPVLFSGIKTVKENGVLHAAKEHTEANFGDIQHHQPEILLSSADQAFRHDSLAAAELQQSREGSAGYPPSTAMPLLRLDSLADELHLSESTAKEKELSEKSTSLNSTKKKKTSTVLPTQDSSKDLLAALFKMQKKNLEKKDRGDTAARERENLDTSTLEGGVVETPHPEAEEAPLAQSQERDAAPPSSTAIGDEAKKLEAEPTLVSWGSDSWGGTSLIPKKKKKSKVKTSYPLPEPPPGSMPLMTPLPPAPPHSIQLEVGQIPIIAEDATVAAIAPVVHKDPKVELDPYAGLSKSQAKKLKAKLDTEAKLKEVREQLRFEEIEAAAAAAAEVAEAELKEKEEEELAAAAAAAAAAEAEECRKKDNDLWAKWDVASPLVSKKKKGKKAERIAREEEEEKRLREEERIHMQEEAAAVVTGAEDAELKKSGEERATAAIAEGSMSTFDATAQTFASYDDDDCGLRLDHLSRNEGWQNCKPCELYLRKIATKLHAVGPPNARGFNAID